jgi:sugar O-acyltransferase (sialic acid O-acetyltransferase NeuD family)
MNDVTNFAIFGASGCGRGIMPIAREQFSARPNVRLYFVDDAKAGQVINGHDVLTLADFCNLEARQSSIALAVADPLTRRALAARCIAAGISSFEVRAPQSVIMDDVEIGEGALISPFVSLTSNIRIGRHFHANLYSYVEHDCVIGDFVTFAPGVQCNGNVHIDDDVYVGAGAVIRQGTEERPLTIGHGAFIGMGAIVTKSVPPGVTVVGNPARPIGLRGDLQA